ncbi:MAG: hypothetical protein KU38_07625 [Sulfurovum sp. FS08-3]|nr:MAG: hypothetical protein KU38_07625 [Sulfurovum sp. FS08-3]
MSVQKKFTLLESTLLDLEELARIMNKKQNQIVQELIAQKMQEIRQKQKLSSLEKMSGIFSGLIPEDTTVQSIKANSAN